MGEIIAALRGGALACAGLALAVLLAGASPAEAGKADDTLNVAFPREVRTVDGLYSRLRENDILGLLIDDALYYVDHNTLKPVPLAAKFHRFVDDKTLDIEIRDNVTFHDGSPMTAEDVVYSFEWIINPESKNLFHSRIVPWLERVEMVDRYTVRFHMKMSYAMVFYDLAYYTKVRKKDSYHKEGKPDPDAQLRSLFGSGPYRVVDFRPGKQITLARYDAYRADSHKGVPAIEKIVIRTIPDYGTQAAELMTGGIDWAFNVPTDVAEDVGRSGRAQHIEAFDMRVGFIVLDAAGLAQPNGPLTKKKVRQALNHAIDRQGIVEHLVKGKSQPLHTACNPIQFGCVQDVRQYEHDPAKAKQLLAEAGYPQGFDLALWGASNKPVLEAITQQFNQVGVRTTLHYVKGPTLSKARAEKKIAAEFSTSGSFSIPDAGAIVPDRLGPDSDRDRSKDPELHEWVMAAVSTFDPEKRVEAFRKALQRTAEEAYWVPTHVFTMNYLLSNDLVWPTQEDAMQRLFLARWK